MGSWFYLAFSKTLKEARVLYNNMRALGYWGNVELWEMEEDRHHNRYVLIGRGRQRGPNPKLKLKRQFRLEKLPR